MTSSIYGADGVTQIVAGPGVSIDPVAGVGVVTITATGTGGGATTGVTAFNTRSGIVTLLSEDVTTALGYTPLSSASIASKQDALISGTNIKTVNGNTLLGSGDLVISGGGGSTGNTTSVATIAALKALSKVTFQYANVAGYSAVGDGGGGLYYYVASDTSTADNGGTIIVGADGGRWYLDTTSGIVTADQFGIDYTRTTAVDAKLQTLIDWCQERDLTPQLRNGGFYKLTTGITLKQGRSTVDSKAYAALLDGNRATLVPYGAITCLAVVPRCLLADQASGRQSGHIDIRNLTIDGFYSSAGVQPFKIGAANYMIYCADWGSISDVLIVNFANSSVLTYFKEASHIVMNRLMHKWGVGTLLIESTTAGSFCGDLIFNAFQGEGTEAAPVVKIVAGVTGVNSYCQTRGIKFNTAEFYGTGAQLKTYGTGGSQVGDVWFNSCQHDVGTAGERVIILESNETTSIFQVHIRDMYAVSFAGTVLHATSNGASTIYACDLSGGAINDCTPHSSFGNAIVYLEGVEAFAVQGVAFDHIYGGPSPSSASVILVNNSTNVIVTDCNITRCTPVASGISVGGTSDFYTITNNNIRVGTYPVNDFTAAVRTKTVTNNVGTIKVDNYLSGYLNLTNATSNLVQSNDGNTAYKPLYVSAAELILATGSTPTETFRINTSGQLSMGTSAPAVGAIVDIRSTTAGVRFPNMTTAQRTAIASVSAGTTVFDTTLGHLYGYNGSAWEALGGAGTGTVTSIIAGTGLSGGTITTTGTIAIANTGVSATSYGSSSTVPAITVNAQGQITAAASTTIALNGSQISSGTISSIPVTGASGSFTTLDASGQVTFASGAMNIGNASYGLIQGQYAGTYKDLYVSAQRVVWATGSTPAEHMRIETDGNLLVGYGSSNGGYRLQVNSQIFATASTIATSDARYKENVTPLTGALALVNKLNPVSFTWKPHPVHNFAAGTTTGFLAQEVQEALKDEAYVDAIVKSNNCTLPDGASEGFLGISEGNIISILAAAIKELSKDLEATKALLANKGIV